MSVVASACDCANCISCSAQQAQQGMSVFGRVFVRSDWNDKTFFRVVVYYIMKSDHLTGLVNTTEPQATTTMTTSTSTNAHAYDGHYSKHARAPCFGISVTFGRFVRLLSERTCRSVLCAALLRVLCCAICSLRAYMRRMQFSDDGLWCRRRGCAAPAAFDENNLLLPLDDDDVEAKRKRYFERHKLFPKNARRERAE